MPRMRTLKPEAAMSESLALVPPNVRWTFAMLWTYLDDEGRGMRNSRLIKAAVYPLDDDITPANVNSDLTDLAGIGAVCFYEVDGKEYVHVPAWHEHQHPNRKVESKLPPCAKTDHSVPTHAHSSESSVSESSDEMTESVAGQQTSAAVSTHAQLTEDAVSPHVQRTAVVVVGDVDVVGDVVGAAATPTALTRGTRLPADWKPSTRERDWTLTVISSADASLELEKFRNYWLAKTGKDATKLEWGRVWRNWVLNSSAYKVAGRAPTSESVTDQRVTEGRNLAAELRREQAGHMKGLSA